MIITVDTRLSASPDHTSCIPLIIATISKIAEKQPQHQFIYIFDHVFDNKYITSGNITGVVLGPEAKSPLLWKYWYDFRVPALLKKYKADIFVGAGGICSLRTKVPQCLLVNSLSFLEYPLIAKKSHLRFFDKFTGLFLNKAKRIVTMSQFSKTSISNKYRIDPGKIDVLNISPDLIFKPVSETLKEIVKEKYADGKEYFLYTGAIHPRENLLNLLKAFSFFKKRQKSNMQLLLAGELNDSYKEFSIKLSSFRFRDEVKILGNLLPGEKAEIVASAYAVIYPSLLEDFALQPLEAMQCDVPVITGNYGALPEICGDAALYTDATDFNDIAEKMMLLFRDEDKKTTLVNNGKKRIGHFTRQNTLDQFWRSILECAGTKN